ncbi:MAG: hypothetical protein WC180_06255 [Candidatus Paceibacterota bacterium]
MSYYHELEKEYAELKQELADMTAEKERCRHECQRAQSLAIESFNNWQKSATDFIDIMAVMERDNAEFVKLQSELEQYKRALELACDTIRACDKEFKMEPPLTMASYEHHLLKLAKGGY